MSAAKANEQGFLVTVGSGSGIAKNKYTLVDDETIISMHNDGKKPAAIGAALTPPRSGASITYRLTRVIANLKSLDEYNYESGRSNLTAEVRDERIAQRKETAAAVAAQAAEDADNMEEETDEE